jgi:hypothetical protein
VGEALEVLAVEQKNLGRKVGAADHGRHGVVLSQVEGVDGVRASDDSLYGASCRRYARHHLLTAVLEDEVDRPPVGREAWSGSHPVQLFSQDPGLTSPRRRDRQMVGGVDDGVGVGGGDVGDGRTVRAPRRCSIRAAVGRDLQERLSEVGVVGGDDPDVGVVVGIGVGGSVADEGNPLAARRPDGLGVVEVSRCDLGELLGLDIEHVQMSAPPVEIPGVVLFELAAVHHPGGRRLLLFLLAVVGPLFLLQLLRRRIL